MMDIVLAIDIGSSSIRCSAYQLIHPFLSSSSTNINTDTNNTNSTDNTEPNLVLLPQHSSSHKMACVHPHSSEIPVHDILNQVDVCLEATLISLRKCKSSSSLDDKHFHIHSIGISTFVMNLICIETSTGNILKTFSYACHEESVVQLAHNLNQTILGPELSKDLYQRTGAPIHAAYALPQLKHFFDTHQISFPSQSNMYLQTLSTLCLARWSTGHCNSCDNSNNCNPENEQTHKYHYEYISYSEASWTGLLDYRSGSYDPVALSHISTDPHIKHIFPTPVDPQSHAVILNDKKTRINHMNIYSQKWPELFYGTTRLYLGEGDGACANIGSKCTHPTRMAMTIGTSAAVRLVLPLPIITIRTKNNDDDDDDDNDTSSASLKLPPGLFCYRINSQQVLMGGALTDGGSIIEWMQNISNLSHNNSNSKYKFMECVEQVENLMKEHYNDIHNNNHHNNNNCNVVVLPFWSGERSTGFRANANGCIFGITRQTTSVHLLKACMEAVVLRLKAIVDLLLWFQSQNQSPSQKDHVDDNVDDSDCDNDCDKNKMLIVASGTALEQNQVWRQMIADCTGCSIVLDHEGRTESTSRGIARMVALHSLPLNVNVNANVNVNNNDASIIGGDDDTAAIMKEEPLKVAERTNPYKYHNNDNEQQSKLYWERLQQKQEALISAVSPLW